MLFTEKIKVVIGMNTVRQGIQCLFQMFSKGRNIEFNKKSFRKEERLKMVANSFLA